MTNLSPRMIATLRLIGDATVPRDVADDPTPQIVAARNRGWIETWQDGTRYTETQHSVGAFGRGRYTRPHYNVPVIRARLTDAGRTVLAQVSK